MKQRQAEITFTNDQSREAAIYMPTAPARVAGLFGV